MPSNAIHLLKSRYSQNRAWAKSKHLSLQCHIVMTAEMVQKWCVQGEMEFIESENSQAVQQANKMQQD